MKLLYKLGEYLGILKNNPMAFQINNQAVLNWQQWLNKTYPPGPWIPTDSFFSAMTLTFDVNGNATFANTSGYPMKGFVNTATGEVRWFDARKFISNA